MQLEAVEERLLNHLATATNPLVPMSALLKHCRRQPGLEHLDERLLLDFLRNHALVKVIEPMSGVVGALRDMADAGQLAAAEPRVALTARIPPPRDLGKIMLLQIAAVIQALQDALEQPHCDPETGARLGELLQRAKDLREKLEHFG